MSYESWRISYQSSEQAARAAYAEVKRLRAALERLEKLDRERAGWAEAWQPIDTAPKDGRGLLVWDGEEVVLAHWDTSANYGPIDPDDEGGEWTYAGGWTGHVVADWGLQEYVYYQPTHWMPLPPAPEQGGG